MNDEEDFDREFPYVFVVFEDTPSGDREYHFVPRQIDAAAAICVWSDEDMAKSGAQDWRGGLAEYDKITTQADFNKIAKGFEYAAINYQRVFRTASTVRISRIFIR